MLTISGAQPYRLQHTLWIREIRDVGVIAVHHRLSESCLNCKSFLKKPAQHLFCGSSTRTPPSCQGGVSSANAPDFPPAVRLNTLVDVKLLDWRGLNRGHLALVRRAARSLSHRHRDYPVAGRTQPTSTFGGRYQIHFGVPLPAANRESSVSAENGQIASVREMGWGCETQGCRVPPDWSETTGAVVWVYVSERFPTRVRMKS